MPTLKQENETERLNEISLLMRLADAVVLENQ